MFIGLLQHVFLFSYISGNHTYPKVLTPEEEAVMIARFSQGDTEARNILIERNMRLVAHIVKKYNNHMKDMEDLISVGSIGLIKGVSSYNADKGAKLATYAARCIENEILMFLRSIKNHNTNLHLQDTLGTDKDGNEVTMEDKMMDTGYSVDEQVTLTIQIKTLQEKICNTLRGREKTVIEMRYGLNNAKEFTQREIADLLGISRSYVSRRAYCKAQA